MKRILNIGSVNVDHVYSLPHFVRPGETLAATSYARFPGGKGFNQSTALARAGAKVFHAGRIGEDGLWLKEALEKDGCDTRRLLVGEAPTGHAVIEVDPSGENRILIHPGANGEISPADISAALEDFSTGDILLLQNETSCLAEAIRLGHQRGLEVVLNPAPMGAAVFDAPLDLVDFFIVNEHEAADLARGGPGLGSSELLMALRARYPRTRGLLMTFGSEGALLSADGEEIFLPAHPVRPVDTTAAGDTFTGFFLARMAAGVSFREALETATAASAICVTRPGAAPSIPTLDEVRSFRA